MGNGAIGKQAGYGLEMQNQCAEIKIRAERRGGKLIQEMQKSGKLATQKSGRPASENKYNTMLYLSDLGVEAIDSTRWQRIADIEEADFKRQIDETHQSGASYSAHRSLRLGPLAQSFTPPAATARRWCSPYGYLF